VPNRSFSWSAGSPGIRLVADHELTPRPDGGCDAVVRMTSHGPLSRVTAFFLSGLTRRYLRMETEGLKRRAQSR
jgi:hypothetical protein